MSAIVMEVTEVKDHPNADALKMYKMTDGKNTVQIVANLENVYELQDNVKVVLAPSVLKDGTKIKATKIRGILSSGMALGKTDLNVGADLTEELCQEELAVDEDELDKSITFVKWPSIEQFHNVRKYLAMINGEKVIKYHGKIKLHGTNSGVSVKDGKFRCQKRTSLISVESDNAGFARFCNREDRKEFFTKLNLNNHTIFGEFAGPNVQKGVAISEIPNKSFCIFAIQNNDTNKLDINPETIKKDLGNLPPDVYVLPFYGEPIDMNFASIPSLESSLAQINDIVQEVEKEDPWVKEVFNISGVGEGLVYYPVSECEIDTEGRALIDRDILSELMFKAKGEKHSVVNKKSKKPANIDPEVAKNIDEFVKMFVTENRLNQIAQEVGFDVRLTGKFLNLFMTDVSKESKAEIEASKLDWKLVAKQVSHVARLWFVGECNKL